MDNARNRPFSSTFLALLVLCFTIWNGVRFGAAVSFWNTLRQYTARLSPLYFAISAAVWLGFGITLIIALWLNKVWAKGATLLAADLYTAWYWFDRLFFQPVPQTNWPFALIINLLILLFVVVASLQRGSRDLVIINTASNRHVERSEASPRNDETLRGAQGDTSGKRDT
jgi:hypothetical protein